MAAKGPGGKGKGPGRQPSSRPNVSARNEARIAKQAVAAAGLGSAPVPAKGQAKIVRLGGPRVLFNALFGVDPSVPNEDVLGTIPQALFLMNSPMVHNRTQARPGTVLGEILMQAPNDQAALNALYLRVLSRHPTAKEIEACSHYMSNVGNRAEAFEDIYWASSTRPSSSPGGEPLFSGNPIKLRSETKRKIDYAGHLHWESARMQVESNIVQVGMSGEGVVSRRGFLQDAGLGSRGRVGPGRYSRQLHRSRWCCKPTN